MITNIGELKRSVSIIGVGCTPFGNVLQTPEIKDMTERELFAWAALEAMEDAGIEAKEIDVFYIAQCMPETLSHTFSPMAMVADWIGMRNKPGFHHETACSSTNTGLRHAVIDVASGAHDIVLSGGIEITGSRPMEGKPAHMREAISQAELWYRTDYGADQAYWYFGGLAVPSICDFPAMLYAKKYGLTLEQMGDTLNAASISNRRNALLNPRATTYKKDFQEEAKEHGFSDVKEYMKSNFNPKIGTIMRAFNGATVVDGASALIVCPTEMAKSFSAHPVEVIGFGSATAIPYHEMSLPWKVEEEAFAQAYKMAKINPYRDIDYMHVHDCLISSHFASAEAGGYFRPGEAWRAIQDGRTAFDGDKPISTTGGRTSMGHAWSASAGAEIAEAVWQMREKAGGRQIKPTPEVSVVHNLGHGVHVNVSVLRTHA
jgi:acetyl-CoA C-acetyltransferase